MKSINNILSYYTGYTDALFEGFSVDGVVPFPPSKKVVTVWSKEIDITGAFDRYASMFKNDHLLASGANIAEVRKIFDTYSCEGFGVIDLMDARLVRNVINLSGDSGNLPVFISGVTTKKDVKKIEALAIDFPEVPLVITGVGNAEQADVQHKELTSLFQYDNVWFCISRRGVRWYMNHFAERKSLPVLRTIVGSGVSRTDYTNPDIHPGNLRSDVVEFASWRSWEDNICRLFL